MRKYNSLDKALIIYVRYIVVAFVQSSPNRNKEGIIIIMDKLLDLTRDFDAAKAAFEAYLDEYDRADDKIHLKIVHTYGVLMQQRTLPAVWGWVRKMYSWLR